MVSKCESCGEGFSTRALYEDHAENEHPRNIPCDRSCGRRGKKVFRTVRAKEQHERACHINVRIYFQL